MAINKRIDTVTFSDTIAEKNIQGDHRCAMCGASLIPHSTDELHIGGLFLNAVCGLLVIVLFSASCCFFYSWSQEVVHHLSDRWVWHEPLDDWRM
jgi:hypothetical protein